MIKHKQLSQKSGKLITGILIWLVLLSSYALAFAVSSPYGKENPLNLKPGDAIDTAITLQNLAGTENMTVKAEILEGSEIATLTDLNNTYFIPLGTKKEVNIRIALTADAKVGDMYNITLSFSTLKESTQGTFGFGSSIEQKIPVIIVSGAPQSSTTETKLSWPAYLIAGIIILLVIIIILIKKRKSQ